MWLRPRFLGYRSSQLLPKCPTSWASTLPLSFGANRIWNLPETAASRTEHSSPSDRLQRESTFLHSHFLGPCVHSTEMKLSLPGHKSFSFPFLAARADMPRSAGNCDYTHFIFYILKPQGISSENRVLFLKWQPHRYGTQAVWSRAEDRHGEARTKPSQILQACVPSWHLWRALANFSHSFLF